MESSDSLSCFRLREVRDDQDQQALHALRRQVFIQEQNVAEDEEWDGRDAESVQLLIENHDGEVVATGRLLPEGRIGRMAVRKDVRGQGLGAMLMRSFIERSKSLGMKNLVLDAQVHAIPFYEKFAFVVVSDVFLDAGIEHRRMQCLLS